jgi:hypothetical protein
VLAAASSQNEIGRGRERGHEKKLRALSPGFGPSRTLATPGATRADDEESTGTRVAW